VVCPSFGKRLILIALALFISACAAPKKEKDAEAYYNRGVAWQKKGDYDRAITDYTKAIEINPGDALAYYNRGNAYQGKGQYERAISDYNKAIELNPKFAEAYVNLGGAYLGKGLYDQAGHL
jgi:tetratricopeptide (TPR) repeat protein